MEREEGFTRSIFDELHSSDIQGDQIEGESPLTGCVNDELLSSGIQGDQIEGKIGVTRTFMMNFIMWIS